MKQSLIPKIFVRLSRGRPNDGLYRVKCLIGGKSIVLLWPGSGCRAFISLYMFSINSFTKADCTFFRGLTAELLYTISGEEYRQVSSEQVQIRQLKEVEAIVPDKLWAVNSMATTEIV